MRTSFSHRILRQPLALILTLAVILLLTTLAPAEKTLGANLHLVLLHGAWVWSGKVCFALASLFAIAALIWYKHKWWLLLSRSLAYCGLFFWLTYLPMSLWVMKLNWGGFFFDEPRWRIPFFFGIVAVLLQAGLWLFNNHWLTAAGNLIFGVVLWWQLGGIENILHPDSPISQSSSGSIQGYFILLLILAILFAAQLVLWIFERLRQQTTRQ